MPQQDLAPPIWPACERLLAGQVTIRLQQHAAMLRAEERTQQRLKELQFVDTRPVLVRSEAFAEDLVELLGPEADPDLAGALLRGLAGVADGRALA